jgi:ATP-dependent DNA helicase RecG
MPDETELLRILDELRALPVETEWLEFKEAKRTFDFKELGRYFSAISNEANLKGRDYGWLVFGVRDQDRAVVGSEFRSNPVALESLKQELAEKTTSQITFMEIFSLQHAGGRVVMFQIPAAPRGLPVAWQGHYYGRHGESLGPLNIQELEQIRAQSSIEDWSAKRVEGAGVADLDPAALALARAKYREKHPELSEEVDGWDDWRFLRKLKIAINRHLTRAALLLLGKPESNHFLPNTNLQISWILQDQDGVPKDYRHFGLPLLTATEGVFGAIRNLTFRHMEEGSLFPTELPQYDSWVIREALHNCIAHQDYALGGKVNVVEQPDDLIFSNLGTFIPGTLEAVIQRDVPPEHYRNALLAAAMVELKMMDTIGSGIKRMFITQRKRLFPLPDYLIESEQKRVEVRLYGRIIDQKYTQILKVRPELSLLEVMWLDAVQKGRPLTSDALKTLRRQGLVEGRVSNLFVSAGVASALDEKATYIRNRGFDEKHYRKMLLEYIEKYGEATPDEIESLLLDKLPEILRDDQKKNKIRNLLQKMSRSGELTNVGGRGDSARWRLCS